VLERVIRRAEAVAGICHESASLYLAYRRWLIWQGYGSVCRGDSCNSLVIPPHPEYDCHFRCLGTVLEDLKSWDLRRKIKGDCGCVACVLLEPVPKPVRPFEYWPNSLNVVGFVTNYDVFPLFNAVEGIAWLFKEIDRELEPT